MRICFEQFLGQNHSWAIIGQSLAREFIKKDWEVHLKSTDGIEHFPKDLLPNLTTKLEPNYDAQISYTCMKNFGTYLSHGSKNRFGIWCYEWPKIPPGFIKYYKFADKILAPSNFARDIFIENKVPEDRVVTLPHGIDLSLYSNEEKYKLKTTASKKILVNIGQPHLRKNIAGMLDAYGRAFNKKDDVCLVAKISSKKMEHQFDVNINQIMADFKRKYPQHAAIELITNYVPNIVSLYNACDIVYTLSFSECFYLPGLEAFAKNKLVISPRYGGQLDFLNDKNSLLIDGKLIQAEARMQYWESNIRNTVFSSNLDDAASKLQMAIQDYDKLMTEFKPSMQGIVEKYTWPNVTDKIIEMMV